MITRCKGLLFKLFTILLLLLTTVSCFKRELTELEIMSGNWLIEEIIEEDTDVTHETNMQMLFFQKNGSCEFPFLNSAGLKWEYLKNVENKRKLILTRNQSTFKREYGLVFKIDERNLLQVELTSENQFILLTKILFYPKDHPDFIKQLLN